MHVCRCGGHRLRIDRHDRHRGGDTTGAFPQVEAAAPPPQALGRPPRRVSGPAAPSAGLAVEGVGHRAKGVGRRVGVDFQRSERGVPAPGADLGEVPPVGDGVGDACVAQPVQRPGPPAHLCKQPLGLPVGQPGPAADRVDIGGGHRPGRPAGGEEQRAGRAPSDDVGQQLAAPGSGADEANRAKGWFHMVVDAGLRAAGATGRPPAAGGTRARRDRAHARGERTRRGPRRRSATGPRRFAHPGHGARRRPGQRLRRRAQLRGRAGLISPVRRGGTTPRRRR